MAEEIVAIKIIPDGVGISGSSGSSLPSSQSGSGILKGMGGMLKGVLTTLGVTSIIGVLVSLVSASKSLMSVVSGIFKLVGTLLKPIADVITVLVMPILYLLKPIVILVNQVMSPFLKLAMELMRKGSKEMVAGNLSAASSAFSGASGVMLQGLSVVILSISSGLVKMIIQSISQMITVIGSTILQIPIFSSVRDAFLTNMQDGTQLILNGVDGMAGTASAVIAGSSAGIAEAFGVSSDTFQYDALNMITSVFSGADGLSNHWAKTIGIGAGFGKVANDAINNVIGTKEKSESITGTFVGGMNDFKTSGVSSIRSAVNAFNDEWSKLKTQKREQDKKDKFLNDIIGNQIDLTMSLIHIGD